MIDQHPDPDLLIDYAEGKLADPREVEAHLNQCPECVEALKILRGIHYLDETQQIPPLPADELQRAYDRLLQKLRVPPDEKGGDSPMPNSIIGSAFGVLGAAWAMGHVVGTTPMLAGADVEASPDVKASPDDDVSPESPAEDSEKSNPESVTKDAPATSSSQTDQAAEMLARVRDLLDEDSPSASGHDAHESPAHHEMEAEFTADCAEPSHDEGDDFAADADSQDLNSVDDFDADV